MFETMSQADWMQLLRFALPPLAVFATAAVLLLRSALVDEEGPQLSIAIALAGLLAAFALAWGLWPEMNGSVLAMLRFDRMTAVSWMVVAASGIAAALLSSPALSRPGVSAGDYLGLLTLSAFGMMALVASADLIVVLLGLETMSLAAYALTGFFRDRARSLEGALKYFLMGAFATAFFLMGVAFLIGSAGTTDIGLLAERAPDVVAGPGRAFFLFGCAMAAIGFAFKVAAVPFHAWAPDAYDGAPTPIAAFMATGVKAAAFVAFVRFVAAAAAHGGALWHHLAMALSVATMVVGNLAAIRQDNLKRMLAYSSIAHAGYLLVVFPSILASPQGAFRAVLLYLVAYVVMTAGAFAAVVALERRPEEAVSIAEIEGLGRRRPWLAAAFSLFLVSLAGFPPTLGFFGKYYLFLAAVKNGDVALVVVAVLASVVSVYYYLRPVTVMYFRGKERPEEDGLLSLPPSPAIVAVLVIAAAAVIAFGIFPQDLVALIQGSV